MKAKVNGLDFTYTIDGPEGAPNVTMSNSLATDHHMWDAQAAQLAKSYRVLRYDTRGHGTTPASPGEYTMEGLAEDARALMLTVGIERSHFIGLSMGGMIGQTLALRYPKMIASLVLADTSHDMAGRQQMWTDWIALARARGLAPILEALRPRWFTAPFIAARPDVVGRVDDMILNTPVDGFVGCCHALRGFSLGSRIAGIGVPTLIIVGEKDGLVEPSRQMQALIPGASLVILPSAAHLSNIEQPDSFNRAMGDFLAGL